MEMNDTQEKNVNLSIKQQFGNMSGFLFQQNYAKLQKKM